MLNFKKTPKKKPVVSLPASTRTKSEAPGRFGKVPKEPLAEIDGISSSGSSSAPCAQINDLRNNIGVVLRGGAISFTDLRKHIVDMLPRSSSTPEFVITFTGEIERMETDGLVVVSAREREIKTLADLALADLPQRVATLSEKGIQHFVGARPVFEPADVSNQRK